MKKEDVKNENTFLNIPFALSSPAGFEPTAFRLGELAFQVIKKPGQYLEKLDFSSNLGKF